MYLNATRRQLCPIRLAAPKPPLGVVRFLISERNVTAVRDEGGFPMALICVVQYPQVIILRMLLTGRRE